MNHNLGRKSRCVRAPMQMCPLTNSNSKKETIMANTHMKRCSTSIVTWKMKITMRRHFKPTRMAKVTESTCWQGCGEIITLTYGWWIIQWRCSYFGKTVWQCLQKLNTDLQYKPTIPLLGIHPRKIKTDAHSETHIQMSVASYS